MIAIDTNLLVFAHFRNAVLHREALRALEPIVEGNSPWGLPWPCVHEFISVVTNSRIYKPCSTLSEAFGFIESLIESPQLQLLSESPGYFEKLRELADAAKISGAKIHDARIAALCLHHGIKELWTADRDFSSFPKLKIRNPLVGQES